MADDDLPWAKPFQPRCRERLAKEYGGPSPYSGRCELVPHETDIKHAVRRGLDVERWPFEEGKTPG